MSGPGVSFIAVYARALRKLKLETASNHVGTVLPGAVFATDPGTAAQGYRQGLIEPVDYPQPDDEAALYAFRERHVALADWRQHGGAQFKTLRRDLACAIEEAPREVPPTVTKLSMGQPEPREALPPVPRQFE